MEYRRLGSKGPEVSRIALGTMTFGSESDEVAAAEILDVFLAAGGTLVDTADVYSDGASEQIIGRWLASRPRARERIVLATKGRFPMTGQPGASLSRRYLSGALDASLRRLGVEHIDLYQAHGPDDSTPLEELAEFFTDAVQEGKVRYAGVSNLPGWQLTKLTARLDVADGPRLVSHQPQYSLLSREIEWEIMPAARDAQAGAIVWGPLAAGWLTGKYSRDQPPPPGSRLGDDPNRGLEAWDKRATERTWAVVERLQQVAQDAGVPMAQAALAWVTDRPGVTSAIVGARTADQLRGSMSAGDLHLLPAAEDALDEVSAPPTPDYPYAFAAEQAARH